MKITSKVVFCGLVVLGLLSLYGCGKKTDENKPLDQVKSEAEKMDARQLRDMAGKYKEAIMAKKGEVEKVAARLKEIPVTEVLGQEAKELKADIDAMNKSVNALKDRFEVYYNKLKETGGDLSGLDI